ncbi:MAG TPA: DinB family protein [Terriglobales bacterium]|nr:DinB family protein [Terriglobales bacterium]
MSTIENHLLDEIRRQMRGHKRLAEGALTQLTDEDFFVTLDSESNSIAILIQHIAGNMRSRFTDFLTSDGEKLDRHRDQEFEMPGRPSREELMRRWEQGWSVVLGTVDELKPEDLARTVYIRQESHTVVQALNRALAHYAFHIGQIVFLAKHLRSSQWKTLSVPRGKSEEFNRMSLEERRRLGRPAAKDAAAQKS